MNECNHYVLRIDVIVSKYCNHRHELTNHPRIEEMKSITYRDIHITITDPITIQSFRATNLPVRTGRSHISNLFINSYKTKKKRERHASE